MTVSLALVASLLWGTSDFYCGTLSRRVHAVTVVFLSGIAGLAGLLLIMAAAGGWHAPGAYLWWGALAGAAAPVAMTACYRALADGTMGVIAPITATGVTIPVMVSVATGQVPSLPQLGGIVAAIVGVVLVSGAELRLSTTCCGSTACRRRSITLAAASAVIAGIVMVLVARGSATSVPMTLLAERIGGLPVLGAMLLAIRHPASGVRRRDLTPIAAVGLLNLAGFGAYAVAARTGPVAIAAVLASLVPVVTILLANRFQAEHLSRVQRLGAVAALCGVALIASS